MRICFVTQIFGKWMSISVNATKMLLCQIRCITKCKMKTHARFVQKQKNFMQTIGLRKLFALIMPVQFG